jgi:hypothetical protein
MNSRRKRTIMVGAIILLLYLVGFIVLWLGGGYVLIRSGRTRVQLPTGLAMADVADWQPLLGHCQPDYQWPGGGVRDWSGGKIAPRCDIIGWGYYPLWIWVKKRHPTFALITAERLPYELLDPNAPPEGFAFHPLRGQELREAFSMIREHRSDR